MSETPSTKPNEVIALDTVRQEPYSRISMTPYPQEYLYTSEDVYKNYGKITLMVKFVCYLLCIASFIWSIVNAFTNLTTLQTSHIFLIIGGLSVYPLLMFAGFFIVLNIYKVLKTRVTYVSAILMNISLISIIIILCVKTGSNIVPLFITLYIVIINIGVFILSFRQSITHTLFSISIERLYPIRKQLLKGILLRLSVTCMVTYLGISSAAINLLNSFEPNVGIKFNNSAETGKYELATLAISGFIVVISLVFIFIFDTLEPVLLGILLFINKKKENNQTTDNNGVDNNNNIDYIKSEDYVLISLKGLKNKNILDNFYGNSIFQFAYKYGVTTVIDFKKRIIWVTKEDVRNYEKGNFPLDMFRTTAGMIYSLLHGVKIQEATNMCIPAFYHSGYFELLNGIGIINYTALTNLVISLFSTGTVACVWLLKIFNSTKTEPQEWIMFGFVLMIVLVSTSLIVGTINALIQGYAQALVCLYIEDPGTILNDITYGEIFKKLMKKKCFIDRIE